MGEDMGGGPEYRMDDRTASKWAMGCHFMGLASYIICGIGGVIGPLIFWLLKREEHPLIDDQGKEAVNFNITILIALVVSWMLTFVFIGFVLVPIVALFHLIFVILAGVAASRGETYRYPLTIRFLK